MNEHESDTPQPTDPSSATPAGPAAETAAPTTVAAPALAVGGTALVLLGVPYALLVCLALSAVVWVRDEPLSHPDGALLGDLGALSAAVAVITVGFVLLTLLLRRLGLARPAAAVGVLTAAGCAAPAQTLVTERLSDPYWSLGTPLAAVLCVAVVAVVLALTRGRRPWPAVLALLAVVLLRAVAEPVAGGVLFDRTLRATEAAYTAYPHDIAVLDAPGWEAVGTRVSAEGNVFGITYEDGSGDRLVLTSAPAAWFADLPGRPDCGSGPVTCEELGDVTLLRRNSPQTREPDLTRTELSPGFHAELAMAKMQIEGSLQGHRLPDLTAEELVELTDRVRIADDGDRDALALSVMSHHEW